jgi:hypothetical protein
MVVSRPSDYTIVGAAAQADLASPSHVSSRRERLPALKPLTAATATLRSGLALAPVALEVAWLGARLASSPRPPEGEDCQVRIQAGLGHGWSF